MSIEDYDNVAKNRQYAQFLAQKHMSDIVYDIAVLEGVNITVPEVQTLLDGTGRLKLTDC